MKHKHIVFLLAMAAQSIIMSGCEPLRQSSKYQFADGFYTTNPDSTKSRKMYVVADGDSVKVYSVRDTSRHVQVDTNKAIVIAFPPVIKTGAPGIDESFDRTTFDLDVLTILFKYRPAVKGFPAQLNTTFNGALYAGCRKDRYTLHYDRTPLGISKRSISHYGYSIGCFAGLGTARIDEYVTLNRLDIEYDGVVTEEGVAAIVGINKISFGLLAGFDHLLDHNHIYWVNQAKPWIGISVGLNLN